MTNNDNFDLKNGILEEKALCQNYIENIAYERLDRAVHNDREVVALMLKGGSLFVDHLIGLCHGKSFLSKC